MKTQIEQEIICTSKIIVEEIMEVVDKTKTLALRHGFQSDEALKLQLATEEACSNAYDYCQKDDNETIKICWLIDEASFTIEISNRGIPFEIKKTDEMNYNRRGRGLQLILHIMDVVEVKNNEPYVTLRMKKFLN